MRPSLLTFDIFGTVLDWRRGMRQAVEGSGGAWDEGIFDRVVDAQGRAEGGPFRRYAEITAESLREVAGLSVAAAAAIGASVGTWPPYPDSTEGLRRLGLTCVYVERPHARPGPADVHVGDLVELAAIVDGKGERKGAAEGWAR